MLLCLNDICVDIIRGNPNFCCKYFVDLGSVSCYLQQDVFIRIPGCEGDEMFYTLFCINCLDLVKPIQMQKNYGPAM